MSDRGSTGKLHVTPSWSRDPISPTSRRNARGDASWKSDATAAAVVVAVVVNERLSLLCLPRWLPEDGGSQEEENRGDFLRARSWEPFKDRDLSPRGGDAALTRNRGGQWLREIDRESLTCTTVSLPLHSCTIAPALARRWNIFTLHRYHAQVPRSFCFCTSWSLLASLPSPLSLSHSLVLSRQYHSLRTCVAA